MGLHANDLIDLVEPVFEIDSYQSKMGTDGNIIVLSFTVLEKNAADDLVKFVESGYQFVLDADATTGEQSDGFYRVYVEMEREETAPEQIEQLVDGVSKLCGQDFQYRYYKSFDVNEVDVKKMGKIIPLNNEDYEKVVNESNMNNFKNFFTKSYVNSIVMENTNELIITKAYADPLGFLVKDFGDSNNIVINEKININGYPEIMYLTKYLGDYNVTKFGEKTLTLENNGYTLVVERL
tara:strand:- start:893 stop:1603 length:711 start_codon:yes stop_codon:yes gene_type:complete